MELNTYSKWNILNLISTCLGYACVKKYDWHFKKGHFNLVVNDFFYSKEIWNRNCVWNPKYFILVK